MKFVFLHRELLQSSLVSDLRREGHGVFVCSDSREAEVVLRLHGSSASLVLAHDVEGLELISLLKRSGRLNQVPFVLTHSTWKKPDLDRHQSGPDAVSTYLSWPRNDLELRATFGKLLNVDLGGNEMAQSLPMALESPMLEPAQAGPVLEDATEIFKTSPLQGDIAISIELPIAEEEAAPGLASPFESPVMEDLGAAPTLVLNPTTFSESVSEAVVSPLDPVAEEPAPAFTPSEQFFSQPSAQESRARENQAVSNESEDLDQDALAQMPYLRRRGLSPLAYAPPLDDAIVPGGAAQAPDMETLRKYLLLREQDVLALSAQLKQARDQVGNLEQQLRLERATNTEFAHLVQEQDRKIHDFEKKKEIALEGVHRETEDLKFELKRRSDKVRLLEHQVREAMEETDKIKERVRLDIRKIRVREKELENRLEIMKKDSEALLTAREQKIVELKRKLDLAEFNSDLLQDQLEKERANSAQLRAKLDKAAQVVRLAGGLLHGTEKGSTEEEILTRKEGTKESAA